MTSSPGQRITLGFFKILFFWGWKAQYNSEKRPREIQKLSLLKHPSLKGELTLLDAAKRKPSTPPPGLLQSWPVLDDSQCTAGPRSGLWLTTENSHWRECKVLFHPTPAVWSMKLPHNKALSHTRRSLLAKISQPHIIPFLASTKKIKIYKLGN